MLINSCHKSFIYFLNCLIFFYFDLSYSFRASIIFNFSLIWNVRLYIFCAGQVFLLHSYFVRDAILMFILLFLYTNLCGIQVRFFIGCSFLSVIHIFVFFQKQLIIGLHITSNSSTQEHFSYFYKWSHVCLHSFWTYISPFSDPFLSLAHFSCISHTVPSTQDILPAVSFGSLDFTGLPLLQAFLLTVSPFSLPYI